MANALKVGESLEILPATIFPSASESSEERRSGTEKPASSAWLAHQAAWIVTKLFGSVPPGQ